MPQIVCLRGGKSQVQNISLRLPLSEGMIGMKFDLSPARTHTH